MIDAILALNAGSSSIKFAAYEVAGGALEIEPAFVGRTVFEEGVARLEVRPRDGTAESREIGDAGFDTAIDETLAALGRRIARARVVAVGHRIVHGGPGFSAPQIITAGVAAELASLISLAPLHQPFGLKIAAAAAAKWPTAQQVACFDTAFHRSMPRVEQLFALPRHYFEEGILRYGFHGLSYEYVAMIAPSIIGALPERMIVAHLGHGCSLCALKDGVSIATTMGFTALEGLPMPTRAGAIDPGAILHLLRERGLSVQQLERCLYEKSGLLGVSGVSGDIRVLETSSDPRAAEALEYFAYRITREIGALTAALGGVDALIFTGGIGENAAAVRARILGSLGWLGVAIDESNAGERARLTRENSPVSAWIIPTNEELMLARHAHAVVAS